MSIVGPSRHWFTDCSSCGNTDCSFCKEKSPAVGRREDRYLCSVTDNSNLDLVKKK